MPGAGGDCPGPLAARLREQGNALFQEQRFAEAAGLYRQALDSLSGGPQTHEAETQTQALEQVLQMNLATCLLRLDENLEEVVELCSAVLESNPTNAKAMFKRGSARRRIAETANASSQRSTLQAAKQDLLQAAKAAPGDRQVRALLEEVTEALRKLPQGSGGFASALGFGKGLYDDKKPKPPPPPAIVCSACGREGHPLCGKTAWIAERARWLDVSEEDVGREPDSFEHDGTLRDTVRAARGNAKAEFATFPPIDDDGDVLSDMSDGEREMLEDCLDATERPYPQPRRQIPLIQVIRCAEEVWSED